MSVKKLIKQALDEDLDKAGDITSNYTIPKNKKIKFTVSNREPIILCGVEIALQVFLETEKRLKIKTASKLKAFFRDGDFLPKNSIIISGTGDAHAIFAAERVALNLMQHLSAIATKTRQYVAKLENNKTKILDTRKTIPGLRILQKYAVKTGAGTNHRMGLYDGILIKDNHIAAAGSIKLAVESVREKLKKKLSIEVECDNLRQVKEALAAKVDIIMLDNMNLEQIKKAVKLIDGKAKIEVSGGINLEMIEKISKTGIDYISVGALTHSVKAVDIGLDVGEN
ncbi:MAG: nicotinate-nucleotide pyrophosphorylase (carboxylating) [Rickettsiaceae bacterium]|jgi:nicotinate-nucleotide pyrophosphorylase (carboxylating)|nr:nicotinate-nucleotide pyrophosphorylase (carboxylating) [Rickettsiaceae bacterium]